MAKTRIHINRHRVSFNSRHGARDPVIAVKRGGKSIYCNEVVGDGPFRVVYSPDKPLNCGETVWIECDTTLEMRGVDAD